MSFFSPFFRLSLSSKCPHSQAQEMFHLRSSALTTLILFSSFPQIGIAVPAQAGLLHCIPLPGWAEQRASSSWTHYIILKCCSYQLNAAIIVLFACLCHAVSLTAGQSPDFSFQFSGNVAVTMWVICTLERLSLRMKFSIWTLQPPARYQLPSR